MYRRQAGADSLNWVDVASCDAADLGEALSRQDAMARLHLRHADGTLVSGAEAFTTLWSALPNWAWAGRMLGFKPVLWLLELAYVVFLSLRRLWRPV